MLRTCLAETFEIQEGSKQGVLFSASYDASLAFPQSITKTMSSIVMLVSAMLVARTIFLIPSSGLSKINFCNIEDQIKVSRKDKQKAHGVQISLHAHANSLSQEQKNNIY